MAKKIRVGINVANDPDARTRLGGGSIEPGVTVQRHVAR